MLEAAGFEAYGTEPNDAMRRRAIQRHPALANRISPVALPTIGQPFGGAFDGILCSAVLMHIERSLLPECFEALVFSLRPGGRMLLSIPRISPGKIVGGRDPAGRRFSNHAPDRMLALAAKHGLTLLDRWDLRVLDTQWVEVLLEAELAR